MTKLLYARMGRDNLRRNYRLYLPYLLACGGTVAMYYILSALAFGDVIGQEDVYKIQHLCNIYCSSTRVYNGFFELFLVSPFKKVYTVYRSKYLTR